MSSFPLSPLRSHLVRRALRTLSCVSLLASVSPAVGIEQPLLYTVPFKAGDAHARIYRIPAIWWQPKKPLMAFAERRMENRQMHGDIDIVLRRSFDNGQTWEEPQVLADLGRDACGNPCILQDTSNGRLWLAFTRSRQQDVEKDIVAGTVPGTRVWLTFSDDDGATWSPPHEISDSARKANWGWYGTGPGLGLFLKGGNSTPDRLVFPAYHTEGGVYRAHTLYSDDHGKTWQLGGDAAENTSEPQIIEADARTLLMNARTVGGGLRTMVVSRDRGVSWQPADGMAGLADNNCQGYVYRCFRNGSEGVYDWIFSHPISPGRNGVHAWLSEDRGKSWPYAQPLWNGPSAYTAMTRVQGGLLGMLIECGSKDVYEQIAFVKFAPEWLRGRKAPELKPPESKTLPR
jgi:sialidase-1